MIISELIKALESARSEFGDVPVEMMYDNDGEIVERVENTGITKYTKNNIEMTAFLIVGETVIP